MTRFPQLARALQAAGKFGSKNCPSSIPTTSVGPIDESDKLVRGTPRFGYEPHLGVRNDLVTAETIIEERLESLNPLASDLSAPQAPMSSSVFPLNVPPVMISIPTVRRRLPNVVHGSPVLAMGANAGHTRD
jgi:hypothetical protein